MLGAAVRFAAVPVVVDAIDEIRHQGDDLLDPLLEHHGGAFPDFTPQHEMKTAVFVFGKGEQLFFHGFKHDEDVYKRQALIYIMRDGKYQGKGRNHPDIRSMFEREAVLNSDWYRKRLEAKQTRDKNDWQDRVAYLEQFLGMKNFNDASKQLGVKDRLEMARKTLREVSDASYLKRLEGTIGLDLASLK